MAFGICIGCFLPAGATPIVVVRVEGGFLIGTNNTRSDGSLICKLHYFGKKLLLLAGSTVYL